MTSMDVLLQDTPEYMARLLPKKESGRLYDAFQAVVEHSGVPHVAADVHREGPLLVIDALRDLHRTANQHVARLCAVQELMHYATARELQLMVRGARNTPEATRTHPAPDFENAVVRHDVPAFQAGLHYGADGNWYSVAQAR